MSFTTFNSFQEMVGNKKRQQTTPPSILTASFGTLTTSGQIPIVGITFNTSTVSYTVYNNGISVATGQTTPSYTVTGLSNNALTGPFTVVPYSAGGATGTAFTVSGGTPTAGSLYTLAVVTSSVTFGGTTASGTTLACSGTYNSVYITYTPTGGLPASGTTVSGANTTSQTYTGLSSNTPYTFSVYAINNSGVQNPTATMGSVNTSSGTPTQVVWLASAAVNPTTPIYSSNGITWTQNTNLGGNKPIYCNYYASGIWVSGGLGYLGYSADNGITWTVATSPGFTSICHFTYVNNTWYASGKGLNVFFYSLNAVNWSSISGPFTGGTAGLVYGNGLWVVYGNNGANCFGYASSVSGPWTTTTTGMGPRYNGSAMMYVASRNIFVATGQGANGVAYSTDGMTWNSVQYITNGPMQFGIAITYGTTQNIWCAVGRIVALYSTDAINWTGGNIGSIFSSGMIAISGIAYSPTQNRWVACGGGGTSSIGYSSDCVNWTLVTTPYSASAYGMACNA
jgi:hypothetical protein